jgi:hypothetical protein
MSEVRVRQSEKRRNSLKRILTKIPTTGRLTADSWIRKPLKNEYGAEAGRERGGAYF